MDEEELGGITFEYFVRANDPDRKQKETKDTIKRIFRKYDKQNKGFVTFEDLRTLVTKDLSENVDEDILR
jgi:Ca2+-binding EF-hand superfamily protein